MPISWYNDRKEERMSEENFARSVLDWYDRGHRDLPWRRTRDAYRIWVSEIMLQQTREEELLKCWEGLGYYSRARSLQKAAQVIMREYGGELPASVGQLRALPGIGDYTAGAIAAIAYGIPAAAVDGNVERVICR